MTDLLLVDHVRFGKNRAPSGNSNRRLRGTRKVAKLLYGHTKTLRLVFEERTSSCSTYGVHPKINDYSRTQEDDLRILPSDLDYALHARHGRHGRHSMSSYLVLHNVGADYHTGKFSTASSGAGPKHFELGMLRPQHPETVLHRLNRVSAGSQIDRIYEDVIISDED